MPKDFARQQPRSYLYFGVTQVLDTGNSAEGVSEFNAQPQKPDLFRCGAAPVGLVPRRRSAFTFRGPAGADTRAWPLVASVDAEGEGWFAKIKVSDASQIDGLMDRAAYDAFLATL